MPGPDTSEADKELDALFAEDTGDKLPVVKAPLPHVNKVLDLKSSPEADAELEKLMAEPEGPHHATKEEANSAEMPTSGKTIEMPVQKIEGKASSRISGLESLLRGAGKQLTANFGDEIVGGLGNALRPSTREGIPAQYAGMDAIDSQRQDEAQARAAHPNYDTAGQVIGATGLGMLLPGGNLASQTGSAAAQLVGSQLGQGQGSLGARRDQAEQNFREHPISTAAAVAAPAIVQGVANVAPKAAAKANELMTHTFMTAPQRAALRAAKGPDALSKLGADAEAAGLFNRRSPMDFFKPISANRVADNAARVQAESGKAIGDFEDQLAAKGVNPDVNVSGIADELHNQAGNVGRVRDKAAQKYAQDLRDAARTLAPTERIVVEGTHTAPPDIPEWMKRESPPAKLPPQPELPGVDTAPRPGPSAQLGLDFVPPKSVTPSKLRQLEMLLPRAEKQAPFVPGKLEGQQMSLDMPMSGQKSLPLEGSPQAPLDFPQTAVPEPAPGAPQQTYLPNMLPGADIPPSAASLNGFRPGQLPLPAQQMEMNLPHAAKEQPFVPGNLQGEQQSFSGMDRAMGGQQRLPHTSAAEQTAMDLPHRSGPQYTQKPLEGTASVQSDTMPLQDAIATKRFQGDQINWARNPNTTPVRRGQDVARKFTWGQLKDTIQRSLDEQAAKGAVDPKALENYRAANKNFTTASTAYDPALRMAERNNQTGLSLQDLMAGSMFGGPTGTVTALASGAARGKLPSTMARGLKATAGVAKAVGAAGPAIRGAAVAHAQNPVEQTKAELPPETPDHEVKAAANSQVKENLGNWYDRFLQKKE